MLLPFGCAGKQRLWDNCEQLSYPKDLTGLRNPSGLGTAINAGYQGTSVTGKKS